MLLEMNGICKDYMQGKMPVRVLADVSLQVEEGDYLAIMGPSGSGKTTLMNLIGCLDVPTAGSYLLNGEDIGKLKSDKLAQVRNEVIGFVFQSFYLLPKLSALDNVALPLLYAGVSKKERRARARAALQKMGLGDREKARPNQLSGGQCQRVAIARAIVTNPKLLLADEPTGALDSASGGQIMDIFDELNANGVTIIMITHEQEVAARAKRISHIRDGVLSSGLPTYESYGASRKVSFEESSFSSGVGGDIFSSGIGGDSFSSGMGGDSFSSGMGGDSFSSGMGGDSFSSGMGGDSFSSGEDEARLFSAEGSGLGHNEAVDPMPSQQDNEESFPIPVAMDYFASEATVEPADAVAAPQYIESDDIDLFGVSAEPAGHETNLAETAPDVVASGELEALIASLEIGDVFASPETEDVFASPEAEDVFASPKTGDVFPSPEGDDLFADPEIDALLTSLDGEDVFADGDGEGFGEYV